MKRLLIIFLMATLAPVAALPAQNFLNGDLNGTIGISTTPTSWLQVPFGDPVSQSTMTLSATSDVTGTTGPVAGNINGNPYAGTTLVSGLHARSGSIWHEGIMQTVPGLAIGTAYTIRFHANVIKQSNATDPIGTWAVYRENTLIGICAPITDNSPVGSNAHPWFLRTLTFTATGTSHNIKFLPLDDDTNFDMPNGVRMGIDSISLRPAVVFAAPMDFDLSLQGDNAVRVHWEDPGAADHVRYRVEHSPDGLEFESIGQVEAGSGLDFDFLDNAPYSESYYRIGFENRDGHVGFTEVRHISTLGKVGATLRGRQLAIHGGHGGRYDILLRDLQGRTVFEQAGPDRADLSSLTTGIYFLRVVSVGTQNAVLERKVVLE